MPLNGLDLDLALVSTETEGREGTQDGSEYTQLGGARRAQRRHPAGTGSGPSDGCTCRGKGRKAGLGDEGRRQFSVSPTRVHKMISGDYFVLLTSFILLYFEKHNQCI